MEKSYFFISLVFIHIFLVSVVKAELQLMNGIENTAADSIIKNRVSEEKYILINGIEQWVTIKGEISKPVILFIHGGPGSPISPYSVNLYKDWEKDFIIVQWDQRGTGRTYGRNAPQELTPEYLKSNPLTLEQMINDGIELSAYLLKHLEQLLSHFLGKGMPESELLQITAAFKCTKISKVENSTTDTRLSTILKIFDSLDTKVNFGVEIDEQKLIICE